MNQCVPTWDFNDSFVPPRINFCAHEHLNSSDRVPSLDYGVAELTWENGQLSMHGLGQRRVRNKPAKYAAWEKPRGGGTLESIVDQATGHPQQPKSAAEGGSIYDNDLVAWMEHHRAGANAADTSVPVTMDALVPCNNNNLRWDENRELLPRHVVDPSATEIGGGTCMVGSCSRATGGARMPRVGAGSFRTTDGGSVSVSGSATCWGSDGSRQMTLDTWGAEFGGGGFTSASLLSPENTTSGREYTKNFDDQNSVCHSRSQACERGTKDQENGKRKGNRKSSVSTKRSRAAAIHNQSERKRRDKINQRMKTLQKLVPNSSKTDKASMLDEVIEHLKQLQGQVTMMIRMSSMTSPMMLPLAMQQQQLQMSMMGMGMGMGMGLGVMDINAIALAAGMPPVIPPSAVFNKPWDNHNFGDCLPPGAPVMHNPLSAFLACQSHPTTMDAYSRLAALYQQCQLQPLGSGSR